MRTFLKKNDKYLFYFKEKQIFVEKNKPLFVYIPVPIFGILLEIWGLISHKPAFTKTQLKALTAGDEFTVINWPEIFSVRPTNIEKAIYLTYNHHLYSQVELPF